ncbi:MAG TPA: ABC transporter substrate-binding protein [Woeseiaceae bacterium]|nr:ABC transporter substrate-binding protein [Woeseiaceae bacterium]
MKPLITAVIALLALFLSLEVFACGDSLYRVGKGVSYRVYSAPLPGSVLVYGQSEAAKQLAEALAQSGHGVRVVENETDFAQEIGKGDYDVVIAAYSDHAVVEANQKGSGTEFIPVAETREEEQAAKRVYDHVLLADQAEIKHYLKAIHKSLKSKAQPT